MTPGPTVKMLGLCKCCLGYSSLEEKKFGGKEAGNGKTESPEIFDLVSTLNNFVADASTKHCPFFHTNGSLTRGPDFELG